MIAAPSFCHETPYFLVFPAYREAIFPLLVRILSRSIVEFELKVCVVNKNNMDIIDLDSIVWGYQIPLNLNRIRRTF